MGKFFTKKTLIFIGLILLLVGVPLGVYLTQQQQDIRQEAAGDADLVVTSFELVDKSGVPKTTFKVGEPIYIKTTLKNQGTSKGESPDDRTYTQIYANKSSTASVNTLSDVNVSMRNGEFGAGSEYTYFSNPGLSGSERFPENKFFTQDKEGTFTARIYINYNQSVPESNFANNQKTLSYKVQGFAYIIGKTYTSAPTGYSDSSCNPPSSVLVQGLRGCVMENPVGSKTYGKVTNTGSTTRKVGMASYKAYQPYPNPYPTCTPAECPDKFDWIWTQEIYGGVTYSLDPGKTVYFEVAVPDCAWQTDVFEGDIFTTFAPPDKFYSGKKVYLDGYYHIIPVCVPATPTPTPSPTRTPTPTNTPTPTPTKTPTPTLTPTNTPSPTPTPTEVPSGTPTPTSCPLIEEVPNVRIICPNCATFDTP